MVAACCFDPIYVYTHGDGVTAVLTLDIDVAENEKNDTAPLIYPLDNGICKEDEICEWV